MTLAVDRELSRSAASLVLSLGPSLFEYRLLQPALIFPFPLFSLHFLVPTLSPHPRPVPRLTARFWVLRSTRLEVVSIIMSWYLLP